MALMGLMAVSHLLNCTKRAVRKLSWPGGLRNGFRQFFIGFGGVGGMDLAFSWSPHGLETNKKLPCEALKGLIRLLWAL